MSGGILGVAGDILSVAFLCFIFSLAIQLCWAFSRRATRPPTPLPATSFRSSPPPPSAACKQLYLLRFQRSATCPVVSAIAPPSSPPNKLRSAYHVTCSLSASPTNVSPLACTVASQSHTADLAKLMQLQEDDVEADNLMCVPPPRGLLFTIKEEGKEEDATEQAHVASDTSAEGSSPAAEHVSALVKSKCGEPCAKSTGTTSAHAPANCSATCANAPGAGLVSQVSSASSEGGVSLWSTSSSPALSFLSASSSPFPTSSPPRSSFWPQSSRFSSATLN